MSIKRIFQKEIECNICHGEKYIEICSTDGSDCEKIICPQCHGKGKMANEDCKLFPVLGIAAVILVIVFFLIR